MRLLRMPARRLWCASLPRFVNVVSVFPLRDARLYQVFSFASIAKNLKNNEES